MLYFFPNNFLFHFIFKTFYILKKLSHYYIFLMETHKLRILSILILIQIIHTRLRIISPDNLQASFPGIINSI
jgi:hypothetical protein